MASKTTRTWAVVITAGVALLGGTAVAVAQSGGTAPAATSQAETGGQEVTGSITLPKGTGERDDTKEQQALAALAKVSPEQAAQAATAAERGTAGTPQLEDENGTLVYQVPVTRTDGSQVEVKIDAGNAVVLATEQADGKNESSESGNSGQE